MPRDARQTSQLKLTGVQLSDHGDSGQSRRLFHVLMLGRNCGLVLVLGTQCPLTTVTIILFLTTTAVQFSSHPQHRQSAATKDPIANGYQSRRGQNMAINLMAATGLIIDPEFPDTDPRFIDYLIHRNSEYETLYQIWLHSPNSYDLPPTHWWPATPDKCMLTQSIPLELLGQICGYLYQADLAHLASTCSALSKVVTPLLYIQDIELFDCLALRYSCANGIIPTLERTLEHGARADHFFTDPTLLVVHGADTAIRIAICADEAEAVRVLLRHGREHGQLVDANRPIPMPRPGGWDFVPWVMSTLHWALADPEEWMRGGGGGSRIPGYDVGRSGNDGRRTVGNPRIVRYLLEAGADADGDANALLYLSHGAINPLPAAGDEDDGMGGDSGIVAALSLGHQHNVTSRGWSTPLFLAMQTIVPVETVRLLLEHGANPSYPGWRSNTDRMMRPIEMLLYPDMKHWAFSWEKAQLLLAHGCANDSLRLMLGSSWQEMPILYRHLDLPEIVQLLRLYIAEGANLRVWAQKCAIPPILAVIWWAEARIIDASHKASKMNEVVRLVETMCQLVELMAQATVVEEGENGAVRSAIIDVTAADLPDIKIPIRKARQTPLQYVCAPFTFLGAAQLVLTLLRFGANLNAVDAHGVTALHKAVMFSTDQGKIVTTLLQFSGGPENSGLNVNARDDMGWTPLHYACCFCFLTKHATSEQGLGQDQIAVVSELLKHGADIHARTGTDGSGWTPLGLAIRGLNAGLVEFLLRHENGARLDDIRDATGEDMVYSIEKHMLLGNPVVFHDCQYSLYGLGPRVLQEKEEVGQILCVRFGTGMKEDVAMDISDAIDIDIGEGKGKDLDEGEDSGTPRLQLVDMNKYSPRSAETIW
ncbi:ankyrin repeat-containing domain protein [Bombardia bombarda]|uniref:Ankyrin repeat-containing domain protein n=1 Tax=Bombardia bombarda TaxID=252184 RepID=A0AA40C8B9_9PEZI|nr:ankyrin repeat-containing domain protein [Bombardia bombarda]